MDWLLQSACGLLLFLSLICFLSDICWGENKIDSIFFYMHGYKKKHVTMELSRMWYTYRNTTTPIHICKMLPAVVNLEVIVKWELSSVFNQNIVF